MESPECTAAAVTKVLAAAGFAISGRAGPGLHDRSDGVYAFDLPLYRPRVAVYSWPRAAVFPRGEAVMCALGAAGYRVDRVRARAGEYLVAWTGGPS